MKQILKWLCLFLLLILSFQQTSRIQKYSSSISMRFADPLPSQQIEAAQACAEYYGLPWPSFWAERRNSVSGIAMTEIRFRGDPQYVFPADYLQGTAPNDLTAASCALSDTLAWELFGLIEATGMELDIEETKLIVCGIFHHNEAILLRPAKDGFTAVELNAIPESEDTYRFARDYAAACGFGLPSQILCGPEMGFWAKLIPWSSVLLSLFFLILKILKDLPKHVHFAFRVVMVLIILTWINYLPQWWIPTMWSDSSFWAALAESILARPRDWITLSPALRDLPVKYSWYALISFALCSGFFVHSSILKRKLTILAGNTENHHQ